MTTRPLDQSPDAPRSTPLHMASGWLETEIEATSSSGTRALLLHEAALLHEQLGNATEAARLQLQAVNTDPQLTEPVERLMSLFEQRHSLKNIGRVVERLLQIATTVEERERASLERAAYALLEQRDTDTAKQILLEVIEAVPNSATAWNLINFVGEQTRDLSLLERAVKARAALSQNATWSGLLLVELAEIQHQLGEFDAALESLDQVVAVGGEITFNALDVLERTSFSQGQFDVLSRVLVSKASILERATHDSTIGDSLGVPRWQRNELHVADAFVRAAIARHLAGSASEAATLLERATGLVPNDPVIQHIALLCAEERRDFDLAITLAKDIALSSSGDAAGSAWLRVAFSESAKGERTNALRAITNGLAAAPHSLCLRAFELNTLAITREPAVFATAIERCAEVLSNHSAKGRCYLNAAEVWARRAQNSTSARAALAQAALFGTDPQIVNRTARLLAFELNDLPWYDESTRRLAASTTNGDEQSELWLELLRLRLWKNQSELVASAVAGLAACKSGAALAGAFEAYRIEDSTTVKSSEAKSSTGSLIPEPVRTLSDPDKPLLRLASLAPIASFERAYLLANIVRDLRYGNRSSAIQQLITLFEKDPSDGLVVAALADLHHAERARTAATSVLCTGAQAITESSLAAIVAIKAALLAAETGDVAECRLALDCVRTHDPAAATILEPWILRKVLPNDAETRRQLLETVVEGHSRDRLGLERFALELQTRNLATAGLILEELTPDASSIGLAIALAKVLLDSATNLDAIETLIGLAPRLEAMGAALRARQTLATYRLGSAEYLMATQHWSSVNPSVAAALEYVGAARARVDLHQEEQAWETLSQRLTASSRFQIDLARQRALLFDLEAPLALLPSRCTEALILNMEASRPGCDPRRRSYAISQYVPLLDASDQAVAHNFVAFNRLAAGQIDDALELFKSLVTAHPSNLAAWEGLRLAARIRHDSRSEAEACEGLAANYQNTNLSAGFSEQAASIWLDELHDETRGESALARAVAKDVRRFSAFDRLFRRVRDRNDGARLLELIDMRLDVSDDVDELVKLHWERARVLRALGDRDAALKALENVTLLEPDHVGALALAAEISIAANQFAEAAKYLDHLARLESAPAKQRVMSGVAAADLYEGKLNLPELAVSVLLVLDGAGLGTLPVRERVARAAGRAQNWDLAAETLLYLAESRESSAGRVEAARLALSIFRDKLGLPDQALHAIHSLFAEVPGDPEAIDFIIEQPFSEDDNRALCAAARDALRARLLEQPIDPESIDRLAQIAAIIDDAPLRQIALGALVAIESGTPEMVHELEVLGSRAARLPSIALDSSCFADLAEVGDEGPLADLFANLAPWFAEVLGPSLSVLGVTKKQRVDPRSGLPVRNEIAAWAGALGLGEFDVYVGGIEPDNVVGIPGETPSLVVGTALHAPLQPHNRQLVARELYAIRRGISLLRHRTAAETAALVVAACRVAEVPISAPAYALVDEFARLLQSLPRRIRKTLPALCAPLSDGSMDPLEWHIAATSSMDRMAALAAGDVSLVVGAQHLYNQTDAMGSLNDRQERLLRFVFSSQYLSLRDRLGIRVK